MLAAALALGAATAAYFLQRDLPPPPVIGGYVLAQPRALPSVTLVDAHGAPFTPADFAGRWSFLYFGYTYCPDVCPIALVVLANLKQRLAAELPGEAADYYLVSVDPARDTPERLREYVAYFDPSFRGLTGSLTDLTKLAEQSASVFFIPPGQSADGYLVSHSNNIVLLDPEGRLHAVFSPPHEPAGIAADFAAIVAHRAALR